MGLGSLLVFLCWLANRHWPITDYAVITTRAQRALGERCLNSCSIILFCRQFCARCRHSVRNVEFSVMKYILVTGGVISGIGKGVISSSIGALLKGVGLHVTTIKIDPYLNIDAGTFSPYEHGISIFYGLIHDRTSSNVKASISALFLRALEYCVLNYPAILDRISLFLYSNYITFWYVRNYLFQYDKNRWKARKGNEL